LIKSGDKTAFETLFRDNYSHLCAYANTFVRDVETAQDLVQEFLFHIWQKKEDLPVNVSVRAYLFKSIHNSCLNSLKHQKIKQRHKGLTIRDSRENSYEDFDNETNVLHDKIRQTIDKLPPERRKVFIMHRYEELKYKEIAEKLNISIKTVENQIGKALIFLRNELKDYIPALLILFTEVIKKYLKS
jgi:RNA polymerase sigma-70 factor, ECF subfamily